MKAIIQRTMWLCFLATALISCSKDKDACDPNDEESPCYAGPSGGTELLLTEQQKNGKTELQFTYNGQNQVVVRRVHPADGDVVEEHFTYSSSQMTKMERKSGGELIMSEEYSYASGNRPNSGVVKDDEGEPLADITYTYSGNSVTETFVSKNGEQMGVNTYTFDDNNNLRMIKLSGGGFITTDILGDYDDKHYRFTNYPWDWKLRSANNPRSRTSTTQGAGTNIDHVWEYTYNDAGYPIKAEVFDKQSEALVETHTFTYKPANK